MTHKKLKFGHNIDPYVIPDVDRFLEMLPGLGVDINEKDKGAQTHVHFSDLDDYPVEGERAYIVFDYFTKNRDIVGNIYLVKTVHGFWETHSEVYLKYRHYGLGFLLYFIAAQYGIIEGIKVASSLEYSECAEGVWESNRLNSLLEIEKKGKRFLVTGKKPDSDEIANSKRFCFYE